MMGEIYGHHYWVFTDLEKHTLTPRYWYRVHRALCVGYMLALWTALAREVWHWHSQIFQIVGGTTLGRPGKMFLSLQAGQNFSPAGQISLQCGMVSLMYFFVFPSKSQNFPARCFPFCLFFPVLYKGSSKVGGRGKVWFLYRMSCLPSGETGTHTWDTEKLQTLGIWSWDL